MPRVLITGHRGFVGKHLCEYLQNHPLYRTWEVFGFDLVTGEDLRNYEKIRSAIEVIDPDYIFHLAGQAWPRESLTDPNRTFEVNVLGTLNLLNAVRNVGSKARILMTGTAEEYGYETQPEGVTVVESAACFPSTPYGVAKLAQTQLGLVYTRQFGIPVVCTRAYNHTGPGQSTTYAVPSFAKRVVEVERKLTSSVQHGDLSSLRNFTDVRDVVRAYVLAVTAPPGIYNVCSSHLITMEEVLDTLIRLSGREIPTKVQENLGWSTDLHYPMPSFKKLADATGWSPEIPIEQTLKDTLDYWRSR